MEVRSWKRPEAVPYPTVWRRFEGRKSFPNGKIPKFRIQDLTEDLLEDALEHMIENYMRDEPLCRSIQFKSDPLAVQEQVQIWREFFKHKLALVCLVENKEELGDESLPIIVGCNMTGVRLKDRPAVEFDPKSPLVCLVFDLINFMHDKFDVFGYYGISECLYALGLSVHPVFRGQGVGVEFMKARFELGRSVGLKATVTVFSNIASQTVAGKAGFEALYAIDYDDYRIDDKVVFKIISTKSVILMGAKIM